MSKIPSKKWTSRGDEQNNHQWVEEKARRGKRKVGRGATKCGLTAPRPEDLQAKPLFSMTFGVEIVIPMEIGLFTMRVTSFSLDTNDAYMTK